jgi:hypothetical protein
MFVPYSFASVNQPDQLRRGVYRAVAEFYGGGDDEPRVSLVNYSLEPDPEVCAADLVVIDVDGSVLLCDYVWMPDRSWRDSAGLKANHLLELVPPELMRLPLVGSLSLPDIELVEGNL